MLLESHHDCEERLQVSKCQGMGCLSRVKKASVRSFAAPGSAAFSTGTPLLHQSQSLVDLPAVQLLGRASRRFLGVHTSE